MAGVKVWPVLLSPQGTWTMMGYPTDSAPSPTPPQTDLRATSCTEKRTDVGSSSSLTAGSPHRSDFFGVGGRSPSYFKRKNDANAGIQLKVCGHLMQKMSESNHNM